MEDAYGKAKWACWRVHTYKITYANMNNALFGVKHPDTHTYGTNSEISDPTKDGYEFFGWQINGSPVSSQKMIIGAYDYDSDLQEVFHRQVADPDYGVTADDLNSDEVRLIMTASDKDGVDMVINTTNKPHGIPANNLILPRVPIEGADAGSISGYLRLNGSPTEPDFYKGLIASIEPGFEDYVKVAGIAVTIKYTNSPRTPRK